MTTRKPKKRWVCPLCNGGVLAPERPRKDDVRRWCLDCSRKTGRMTERTCPALDRARTEKKAKVAAKRTRVQTERRERIVAERSAAGEDLYVMARRLWKLPALTERRSRRIEFPVLDIRRHREGWKEFTSGRCHVGREPRITMTIGTDGYGAWETLLHEIVHASLPYREGHSRLFWNVLRAAASEAWPEVKFRFHEAPERGYDLDSWIGARLADHFAEVKGRDAVE